MGCAEIISGIKKELPRFNPLAVSQDYPDEILIKVDPAVFKDVCAVLHKILNSPVMMLFAVDERQNKGIFIVNCVFIDRNNSQWITVGIDIQPENPCFDSLAKDIYSASLFEREIWEMFGIEPKGSPDLRRLNLHDEVWPRGNFPLRKDFKQIQQGVLCEYKFSRVEGEGIFEVLVGPVHAGIIGPGHFRFSVAGEPIINLELRMGWTHRGIEKLFEGKDYQQAITLAECVSGDSSFAHSLAFSLAAEKISGIFVDCQVNYIRAVFLELERMYNHVHDIGGMSIDVGFSFPAAYASIIKEAILQLNENLTGHRYLKKINRVGGIAVEIDEAAKKMIFESLEKIKKDFDELVKMLNSSVSFMDRVDSTGILKRKTAEDFGVIGLAARASGIAMDLRKTFPGAYGEANFKMAVEQSGDVLARLKVRFSEFKESARLIEIFISKINPQSLGASVAAGFSLRNKTQAKACLPAGRLGGYHKFSPFTDRLQIKLKEDSALGYVEGWRGPVLYWLKTDAFGLIERCKIVDASFHNWQGLAYSVLGDIIPDFPLCNKSFDLSYSGNDL